MYGRACQPTRYATSGSETHAATIKRCKTMAKNCKKLSKRGVDWGNYVHDGRGGFLVNNLAKNWQIRKHLVSNKFVKQLIENGIDGDFDPPTGVL